MERVYIGIGSNLGDAAENVRQAINRIGQLTGVRLERAARLYGSKPFGPVAQQDFVNTVAEVSTDRSPQDLLNRLKSLEVEMGRRHGQRWGPREIDLDILLFGERHVVEKNLELPHPGIAERAFVLVPLAELNPGLRLPNGLTVQQATALLQSDLVWSLEPPIQGGL